MSASDQNRGPDSVPGQWFRTTHWSVVLGASQNGDPQQNAALAKLCQTYWYPVYSYVRRLGRTPDDAKDLTQEFFLRLMEKDYLKGLDRETGKFRSFLLVVLKRFLANEWDRANCQKRGGRQQLVSLDQQDTELRYLAEPVDHCTPDKIFDRRCALAMIEQAISRLQTEMAATGKAELFGQVQGFLRGDGEVSYTEAAARCQMNESALRVAVHRLRRRYRELIREEIAATVGREDQIEDEIQHLFLSLS